MGMCRPFAHAHGLPSWHGKTIWTFGSAVLWLQYFTNKLSVMSLERQVYMAKETEKILQYRVKMNMTDFISTFVLFYDCNKSLVIFMTDFLKQCCKQWQHGEELIKQFLAKVDLKMQCVALWLHLTATMQTAIPHLTFCLWTPTVTLQGHSVVHKQIW